MHKTLRLRAAELARSLEQAHHDRKALDALAPGLLAKAKVKVAKDFQDIVDQYDKETSNKSPAPMATPETGTPIEIEEEMREIITRIGGEMTAEAAALTQTLTQKYHDVLKMAFQQPDNGSASGRTTPDASSTAARMARRMSV